MPALRGPNWRSLPNWKEDHSTHYGVSGTQRNVCLRSNVAEGHICREKGGSSNSCVRPVGIQSEILCHPGHERGKWQFSRAPANHDDDHLRIFIKPIDSLAIDSLATDSMSTKNVANGMVSYQVRLQYSHPSDNHHASRRHHL